MQTPAILSFLKSLASALGHVARQDEGGSPLLPILKAGHLAH